VNACEYQIQELKFIEGIKRSLNGVLKSSSATVEVYESCILKVENSTFH